MIPGRFILGATFESAEQGRLVFGSNDWMEVEAQALGVGIRLELRVEGPGVTLRIVGFQPSRPSADHEITTQTIPFPGAETRPEKQSPER